MNESVVEVQGVGGGNICCRRKDVGIVGCYRVLEVTQNDGGGPVRVFFRGTEWVLKRGGWERRSKTFDCRRCWW